MAVRATSGPKKSASARSALKGSRSRARKPLPTESATETTPARTASTKADQKTSKAPATTVRGGAGSDAFEMLKEQNEALRAELDQAHARIRQLEDLNRNVADRIDWVIESLQGALPSR